MAAELVRRSTKAGGETIDLTPGALQDLNNVANNVPIDSCGAQTLHPALLQVLLVMSDKSSPKYFKMSINNFVTGHACDGAQHPLGKAADIQNINDGAIESWDKCATEPRPYGGCGSVGNPDATRFVTTIASVMPYGGRIGQITCTDVKNASIPSYIETFQDTCNHIHIDVKDER